MPCGQLLRKRRHGADALHGGKLLPARVRRAASVRVRVHGVGPRGGRLVLADAVAWLVYPKLEAPNTIEPADAIAGQLAI